MFAVMSIIENLVCDTFQEHRIYSRKLFKGEISHTSQFESWLPANFFPQNLGMSHPPGYITLWLKLMLVFR